MQKIINQLNEIENNVKESKESDSLVFINRRYEELEKKLNIFIKNINVIFETVLWNQQQ